MKTNDIPQYFCMRGNSKRYNEIKEIFEKNCNVRKFSFKYDDMIYVIVNGNIDVVSKNNTFYDLLIATQTITDLPPVKED